MTTASVVFLAALSLAGAEPAPEVLAPARSIRRVLGAGERLTFSVVLEEGRVLPLVVRQEGRRLRMRPRGGAA